MTINVMTWNTGLYIFGNKMEDKSLKPIDDNANKTVDGIFGIVKRLLEKEKAVAILQEVPYVSNLNCYDLQTQLLVDIGKVVYRNE